MSNANPRYKNGNLRRKYRARFKAMGLPCHICGRPIDYSIPSKPTEPMSFVIDEIRPISKYYLFGYNSPEEAAQDWNNLAPAHRYCNAVKSNKIVLNGSDQQKVDNGTKNIKLNKNIIDGEW